MFGFANGRSCAQRQRAAVDLTETAAWSSRVRSIGGLLQATVAVFWLARSYKTCTAEDGQ